MANMPDARPPLLIRGQDLKGKVAVVTGATRGIGRAIAENLACRGCSILATCSSEASLRLVDEIIYDIGEHYKNHHSKFLTPKIRGLAANILSPNCANDIADAVDRHFKGRLDIFINNAGITGASPVGATDAALIEKFCLGNIQTPALIVDELVRRRMFEKNSRIVLMSSSRSKKTSATSSLYTATKAAGEGLVRSWADAFGGRHAEFGFMAGTTANSVLVGVTRSDAAARRGAEAVERFQQEFTASMSLPHAAEVEDIADVVGLLCSKESRWLTGSVVSADGGGLKVC